jgi:hypothetical protein
MIVGRMTQFLTKAQGMLKNIELTIIKIVRNFIWDDAHFPLISLKQLYQPKEMRGINLLNIKARNKAIEITWVKAYLNLSSTCPAWVYIMDLLINDLKLNNNETNISNPFLTSWDPPTKGPRANTLPLEIRLLLKTTQQFNISFALIKISKRLKRNSPPGCHILDSGPII